MTWASDLKRGETQRAEKVGGKNSEKTGSRGGMSERRRMLKGSGSPSGGRLHHHHWTTTAQKLDENLSTALISSFWRRDEPLWFSASHQEATCLVPSKRNSRGPLMMQEVGKRNGDIHCWWGQSMREMCGFWDTLHPCHNLAKWLSQYLYFFSFSFLFF